MVTIYRRIIYDKWRHEVTCMAADTKPTQNIANGSYCIEMDTGKLYFYDAEHEQWWEF